MGFFDLLLPLNLDLWPQNLSNDHLQINARSIPILPNKWNY